VVDLHTPLAFAEKTDIEIRAIASAGTSNVSAEFEGIYIAGATAPGPGIPWI
jgi:hypothetical protein